MKRLLTIAALALLFRKTAMAENLKLRIDGDHLRVSAPQLHFLTAHALEKLQNGAVVNYLLQLTVRAERTGKILARTAEHFTVSYDLWEEKFAVKRLAVPERSASNLSASAAESWCIENLWLRVAQLPSDRPFWIAVEFESESAKDNGNSAPGNLTLGSLIDIFSRKPRDETEIRGSQEIGPVRLDDLRKKK